VILMSSLFAREDIAMTKTDLKSFSRVTPVGSASLCVIALLTMSLDAHVLGQRAIEILDLGTLGGTSSWARAVNDSDEVVGESTLPGDVVTHAFVWTESMGMRDIGTLGGSTSGAYAVNNAGQVVGESRTGNGPSHGFVWSQQSGMVDVGSLGGGHTSVGAINDTGDIVGSSTLATGASHAFLWSRQKGMIDLGTLGGTSSSAVAINARGWVIGNSMVSGDSSTHAFLWTEKSGLKDLGTLGGSDSAAFSINDRGDIVGTSRDAFGVDRAFLWTERSGMMDLGPANVAESSFAHSVNARGQIVGEVDSIGFLWTSGGQKISLGSLSTYSNPDGLNNRGDVVGFFGPFEGAKFRGFLWTARTGMVDLGSLGIGHSRASAINAGGTIVGQSITPVGEFHAAVWRVKN
jgi:probable HAF family extracellular repeat protein